MENGVQVYLVVGVGALVAGVLWAFAAILVIRREDRAMTRVSRFMSATAFVALDAVLVGAYIFRVEGDLIRFGAVFVTGYIIVAALASILVLMREGKELREPNNRRGRIGRRPPPPSR